jgi:hypothetical protein
LACLNAAPHCGWPASAAAKVKSGFILSKSLKDCLHGAGRFDRQWLKATYFWAVTRVCSEARQIGSEVSRIRIAST